MEEKKDHKEPVDWQTLAINYQIENEMLRSSGKRIKGFEIKPIDLDKLSLWVEKNYILIMVLSLIISYIFSMAIQLVELRRDMRQWQK